MLSWCPPSGGPSRSRRTIRLKPDATSTLAPSSSCEARSRTISAYGNVNGLITDAAHAVIQVYDHGFLNGEGVYEVFCTYHGVPFLFDRHQARLRASAARLGLDVPFSDAEVLRWSLETMDTAGRGKATHKGGPYDEFLAGSDEGSPAGHYEE